MSNERIFYEGKFTIIPNELLEAIIAIKMSGTQFRICLYLLRNTNGWQRYSVSASLTEIAGACGSIPQWISKQIHELVERKIIIRSEYKTGKKPVYMINSNITEWVREDPYADKNQKGDNQKLSCESMIVTEGVSCDHMREVSCESMREPSCDNMIDGTLPGLEQRYIQETLNKELNKDINKDLNKGKESEYFTEDSLYYTLAKLLQDKIVQRMPEFKLPDLQKWAETMKKVIVTDERNPETVERVIAFCQSDPFWQSNILNVDNLRLKFDYLNAKRLSRAGKSSKRKYDEYDIYLKD